MLTLSRSFKNQVVPEIIMFKITLSVLIIYLSLYHAHPHKITDVETSKSDNHFDHLVLSQEWPVTTCKHWMHEFNGSECVYPNKKNQWTLHGIWPRTVECKYPEFCNNSWAFDPEQIKSIEVELDQAWTNIYKGTDSYIFWGHEWLKHGTCATDLEPFNSQFKYFSMGIEWHQKYSLLDMFDAANIFPSDTREFTLQEFANAVKAKTKKNPMAECYILDGVQYLDEIRLCIDKQLNLIDCVPSADTNCDVSKGIIFPATA